MQVEEPRDFRALSMNLPPEWSVDYKEWGRGPRAGHKVVVLDDDPTGTQTVSGVRVLTDWKFDPICQELLADAPVFYILTNSRSLPLGEADRLSYDLGKILGRASARTGVRISVVSRGDSTLRGHFPDEVFSFQRGLEDGGAPAGGGVLLIPAFFEGGRYTLGDVHWLHVGDEYVPVAQTEFAKDPAFGFRSSRLQDWVDEKSNGSIRSGAVRSVDLHTVRTKGPDGVAELVKDLAAGEVAVVNAVAYSDLEVVAAAFWKLNESGRDLLVRSAASFVPVLAGIRAGNIVDAGAVNWARQSEAGALVVVGSHVELTNRQLGRLLKEPNVATIEIDPVRLVDDETACEAELARAHREIDGALRAGRIAVAHTSRNVLSGDNAASYLNVGQKISEALSDLVARLSVRPRFVVAKGGITSSDVASRGFACTEATVLGQVIPGVPVWELGAGSAAPGLPYVVFPGNVGDDDDLARVVRTFWTHSHENENGGERNAERSAR